MSKNILFFSPYQAIAEHSFIELRVAEFLKEKGFGVRFLGCNGVLQPFCIAMSAMGLNENSPLLKRKAVCFRCKKMRSSNPFKFDVLEDFLSAKDYKDIERTVKEVTLENIETYNVDGYLIGRIASYELIINKKVKDVAGLSKIEWRDMETSIRNVLTTYKSYRKYLEKNKPDTVVVYNSNYGTNSIIREYNEKHGIKTAFIHGSLNWDKLYRQFIFSYLQPEDNLRKRIDFFEKNLKEIELDGIATKDILAHMDHVLNAKSIWVYSEKARNEINLHEKYGLNPNKPTALLSMSCSDEIFSVDFAIYNSTYFNGAFQLFKDQVEWIKSVLDYFEKHPEYQLVLRLHPREFPNKREGVLSQKAEEYLQLFKKLPPNVVLNHPAEGISIYDFRSMIHLHLTSYSIVGMELAWFGIPTVSMSKGISLYPNGYLNEVPKTRTEFFDAVTRIMNSPKERKKEIVERIYNWLLYDFNKTVLDFDLDEKYFLRQKNIFQKILGKLYWPDQTYAAYKESLGIPEKEGRTLLKFFEGASELYELKQKTKPVEAPDFEKFLVEFQKILKDQHFFNA